MERLKIYLRDKVLDLAKICSKNSATSLSMLLAMDVVPNSNAINTKPIDDLFRIPDDNIVVISDISGDLSGTMIASFKSDDGMKIINKMLGRDVNLIKDLEKTETDVLTEYINVIGGSFLTEFSNRTGHNCLPEIPNFEGRFKEVQELMVAQLRSINDHILLINSSMYIAKLKADAVFYILFDNDSLNLVINAITKGVEDEPFENV